MVFFLFFDPRIKMFPLISGVRDAQKIGVRTQFDDTCSRGRPTIPRENIARNEAVAFDE
jgi:hypothetical protein